MEQYYLTCLALALNINGDVNKKEYRYYVGRNRGRLFFEEIQSNSIGDKIKMVKLEQVKYLLD